MVQILDILLFKCYTYIRKKEREEIKQKKKLKINQRKNT